MFFWSALNEHSQNTFLVTFFSPFLSNPRFLTLMYKVSSTAGVSSCIFLVVLPPAMKSIPPFKKEMCNSFTECVSFQQYMIQDVGELLYKRDAQYFKHLSMKSGIYKLLHVISYTGGLHIMKQFIWVQQFQHNVAFWINRQIFISLKCEHQCKLVQYSSTLH